MDSKPQDSDVPTPESTPEAQFNQPQVQDDTAAKSDDVAPSLEDESPKEPDTVASPELHDEPTTLTGTSQEAPSNSELRQDDTSNIPATPPAQPVVVGGMDGPTASSPQASGVSPLGGSSHKRKRTKLIIVAVVVAILVLAGGYAFAFYLPNTPSNVYKSGLTNTGKAVDKLIDYAQQEQAKSYKSVSYDGKVNVKSGMVSGETTLSGAFDHAGNGTLNAKLDIMGQHVELNGRSVVAKGNTSPDLYLQVSGIKTFLDGYGMSSLDSLDGQWISIDHTLVDTYKKGFESGFENGLGTQSIQSPTLSEVTGTIAKMQEVNKQYIFTTDSSKAVLTEQKFLGKETKDGRSVDHYKVGYDKAHMQDYVSALKTTLDASPLNDWSKKANNGKSLSEFMNWNDLEKSVKDANGNYSFDVWVDTKTKLISSVQFTDPSDKSSTLTIGQSYTGGSTYPLSLSFNGKDDTGTSMNMVLKLAVDTSTHKYTGAFTLDTTGTETVNMDSSFSLTPNNNSVTVTAPANAKSINDVLSQLGLGSNLTAEEQAPVESLSL